MTRKISASRKDFFKALPMLRQLNFGKYSPAVVGLIGSPSMVDELFNNMESSVWNQKVDDSLHDRLQKLLIEFIPQIAEYNGMSREDLLTIPTRNDLDSLFANAGNEKMLQGENRIFLRVIYYSLKNFLQTFSQQ